MILMLRYESGHQARFVEISGKEGDLVLRLRPLITILLGRGRHAGAFCRSTLL